MAGIGLACKTAADDLHQPAGPASDRRRDPGDRGSVARHALGNTTHHTHVTVQPMSLAYVGFGGVPMGRGLRERVAWYGDVELVPHLLGVLASGAVDVTVSWGEATAYDMSADRKAIARGAEQSVRRMTAAALRATSPAQPSAASVSERLAPLPNPA